MILKTKKNNKQKICLLVGPTNVGKSTYFNRITWASSPVGNIEGLTTSAIEGKLKNNKEFKIVDLPGINNMSYNSEDQAVTFNYLMNEHYDEVINIVSANSLKRDLILSLDLYEAGILNLINVNMIDELCGYKINQLALSSYFKVQVNLVSSKNKLLINNSLIPIITNKIQKPKAIDIKYNDKIENFISAFIKFVPEHKLSKRFLIIQALSNNHIVLDFFNKNNILKKFNNLKTKLKITEEEINSIFLSKQAIINNLFNKILVPVNDSKNNQLTTKNKWEIFLDKIFLNKYLSIPIFILIICLIWFLTFYQYTGGWIQEKLANDGFGQLQIIIKNAIINISANNSLQAWWAQFVSDGLLGGIFTVLSFIPWIIILVFCTTLLEQIGIMSRVCIAFDNFFMKFGLSGRSIINIITGVGCNVPAILMAKNANSRKERIISIMVAPFINCSARIVVFGFLSQLLISNQWTWLFNFAMTLMSIIFCLIMAYFYSNLLFKKTTSFFITEIVKYHQPDFFIIIKKVVNEIWEFIRRVVLIVFICNLIIWLLTYLGPIKSFYIDVNNPELIQKSFLRYLSIPFQIIVYPLGIGQIWQLPISLITAIPAKEIAASNIETLFNGIDGFKQIMQEINLNKSIVLSYLIFFSFYIACISTISVMKKQIGLKYCLINLLTSFVVSWSLSFVVFNIASLFESINHLSLNNYQGTMLCTIAILVVIIALNKQWKTYLIVKNKIKYLKVTKVFNYCLIGVIISLLIANDGIMLSNAFYIN